MQTIAPILNLRSALFLNMLQAGAQQIITNEAQLNQLNVYPVTDRDTGSNMASLMRYLLAQSFATAQLPSLLSQVADAGLVGACGNSGMIFAAFLDGMAAGRDQVDENAFTSETFLNCLRKGVQQAYDSVSVPVEGTILTVMKSFLSACEEASQSTKDFIVILEMGVTQAEIALRETEYQLSVLEENHVIDAGALGFFLFAQGMYEHMLNPDKTILEVNRVSQEALDHSHDVEWVEEESQYCYCMETLLRDASLDAELAKVKLAQIADSIVINSSPSYTKIHCHTNDIQAVTDYFKQYGTVQHQKIDNMKKQWEITHKRKNPIALITDSGADIPEEFLLNEQIHVLPLQVRVGEHALLDGMTANLADVYKSIDEQGLEAKTASPSVEVVSRYLRYLASNYESAIILTISSKLSSTFQLLKKQAAEIKSIPIDVIDTKKNTAAQGLLVMAAARYINQGLSREAVVEKIKALREDTHIFVAVKDFKTMVKSGRVPNYFGKFADWAHFRPVLGFNGTGKASFAGFGIGEAMSWRKMTKLIQQIKDRCEMHSFAIVHTAAFEEAKRFADHIQKQLGIKIDYIRETSCAIGLHAGKGCIAIAACKESLR